MRASLRWYSQRALAQLSEGAWLVGGIGADAHLWQPDRGDIALSCKDSRCLGRWDAQAVPDPLSFIQAHCHTFPASAKW